MTCRQCGTTIADKAIVCFRCGAPTADPAQAPARRPRRGGWGAIFIAVVVILAGALWWLASR